MLIETYPDLVTLWRDTTIKMIRDPDCWDATKPPRLFSYPNLLIAESHEMDADLSWAGLTRSRWTRFLNRYVDYEALEHWLIRVKESKGMTSLLWRTKEGDDHTGGECLIAISFRPDPGILTLYTREAEFPMRGLLDATFAHLVCREIGRGPIKIVWQMGGLYVSLLHALPFMYHYGILDEVMQMTTKAGKYTTYMTNHLKKDAENLKYGPAKRVLKRWQSMEEGTMVPVPIDSLPLRMEPRKKRVRR